MAETIGHYEVLERMGAGNLGDTYRARDAKLGRTVTLILVPEATAPDEASRAALVQDALRATALSHPCTASLFDVSEHEGRVYLAFEYVAGGTLRAYMGDRPLNPKRALDLVFQVADALADGHAQDVVHADLSPETIMVTPTGRAKVMDFGFARWTESGRAKARAGALEDGEGPSTLAYMSPEQALGGRIDHRSDLFSLGCVLYELLTGVAPFGEAGGEPTRVQVLTRSVDPPSARNPRVPTEVDGVVEGLLRKSPEARQSSAAALSSELKAIALRLDEMAASAPAPATSAARAADAPRRGRWKVLLAVLVALLLLGGWCWRSEVGRLIEELPLDPPPESSSGG